MVLKKSKFGGNTGNTLRRVGGCSIRSYSKYTKTAGFITKEYNIAAITTTNNKYAQNEDLWLSNRIQDRKLCNAINSSANVKFSLNKHKQWYLPDQLKEEIGHEALRQQQQQQAYITGRPTVALVEKAADWTFYRGYRHVKEYTTSGDPIRKHKWKSWRGPAPPCVRDSHIVYTVEKAIRGNWPYHTESYTKNFSYIGKQCHKKYAGYRKHQLLLDTDLYNYTDDELDDNDEDDYDNDYDDDGGDMYENNKVYKTQNDLNLYIDEKLDLKTSQAEHDDYDFCLDEIPDNMVEVCSKSIPLPVSDIIANAYGDLETEGYDVIRQPPLINIPESKTYKVQSTDICKSDVNKEIECCVYNEAVNEKNLRRRFGRRYAEGNCTPRRFIIFDEKLMQSGTFICVYVICEGEQHSDVGIKFYGVTEEVETRLDRMTHGVLHFNVLATLCFSRCCTSGTSTTSDVLTISNSSHISQQSSYLEKHFKLTADIITMNDVWFNVIAMNGVMPAKEASFDLDESLEFTSVCLKCFSGLNLTCLKSCGHSFCRTCWVEYIQGLVPCSSSPVICPEQGCEQFIDPIITLSYLQDTEVMLFIRKYTTLQIQRTPTLKSCPSGKCTNIASYKCNDGHTPTFGAIPTVNCHHNSSWCFNCEKGDHWPSSCEDNEHFWRERDDVLTNYHNNGELIKTFISYKKCPACNAPFEKDGGCHNMICICGGHFCWVCLKGEEEHKKMCIPVNETKLYLSALGLTQNRAKVRMIFKANYFRLKVEKCEDRSKCYGFDIFLVDCYKLLENLCVRNAFTNSKHARPRVTQFVERLEDILLDEFVRFVECMKDNEGDIIRRWDAIKLCLDDMTSFGIAKK